MQTQTLRAEHYVRTVNNIAGGGSAYLTDIAAALGVEQAEAKRALTLLEYAGFADALAHNQNGELILSYKLTEKGEEMAQAIAKAYEGLQTFYGHPDGVEPVVLHKALECAACDMVNKLKQQPALNYN